MANLTVDEIKQNLEVQLQEIEMLQSMFPNAGEISLDPLELAVLSNFVNGTFPEFPPYIDFTIRLKVDTEKFDLNVTLSHEYPNTEPELFVRNEKQNRALHTKLNRDLIEFITSIERGVPCIFDVITWLQENAEKYIEIEPEINHEEQKKPSNNTLVRYWIYSHHIYSTIKRKEIISLATSLKLNGFSLPGKPGIVCVEGTADDCDEWWQAIKAMNWKRIFIKVNEECTDTDQDGFLKFSQFEEIAFYSGSQKPTHMDMSELLKYLENHGCGYIFKDLFRVDQKNAVDK